MSELQCQPSSWVQSMGAPNTSKTLRVGGWLNRVLCQFTPHPQELVYPEFRFCLRCGLVTFINRPDQPNSNQK